MTFYFALFLFLGFVALTQPIATAVHRPRRLWRWQWVALLALLTLVVGLRDGVGADWRNYIYHVEEMWRLPLSEVVTRPDPAYFFLNWIGANFFGGIYFVNTACAFLFAVGLIVFARAQPLPWLAIAVAVPYLLVVVAMGYTRQGVAIGLVMIGFICLLRGGYWRFMLTVVLGSMFHKSAVVVAPLALIAGGGHLFLSVIAVFVTAGAVFFVFLQQALPNLLSEYIDGDYQSSGAAIRIGMNLVPAAVFFAVREKFRLSPNEQRFWTWVSASAFAFVPLLLYFPSTTAVDRVALYWIPLQLFVLSRLPIALARFRAGRFAVTALVVLYSLTVMAIWLFFGSFSQSWIPYRFYPFEAMY